MSISELLSSFLVKGSSKVFKQETLLDSFCNHPVAYHSNHLKQPSNHPEYPSNYLATTQNIIATA